MTQENRQIECRGRCLGNRIALVLLFASLSVEGCRSSMGPQCIEQSTEALIEIQTGQLEDHAPFVAAWEREQARACGWVIEEDYADPE